jgi:hypothetical protein
MNRDGFSYAQYLYDSAEEFPNDPPSGDELVDEQPSCAQCCEELTRQAVKVLGRLYCSQACAISDGLCRLPVRFARRHWTERMVCGAQ